MSFWSEILDPLYDVTDSYVGTELANHGRILSECGITAQNLRRTENDTKLLAILFRKHAAQMKMTTV